MTAYRDCWRLAWPLILANLSVPLLGLVDTAVVGHLPEPHFLAATALGALVMSVLYFLFGFLRMGTTALVAQAFGAHDSVEQRAVPIRAVMVAGVLGLVLIAASPLVLWACGLVFAPAPAVAEGLHTYLLIRVFGAPAALGSFVVLGWFLGVLDSRRPLLLLVLTNAINAILAVAFVWGLGLGVAGAAISTLVAETAGFAAGVALVLHRWRGLPWPSRRSVLQRSRFVRLLVVNRDLFLRSLMLESVFVAFSALGSRQGEVVLAANAILMNFFTFSAYGLDGFAHAAEAMIGRAVGARDVRGFRAAARAGFGLAALLAVPMTLAFWLAGPAMVRLMTDIPSVLDTALRYLPFAAILPAVSIWAFVFDGIFFGATRTAELRNAMLATLLVFAGLAAILPGAYGNSGLWTAFLVFLAARAVFLGLIYWRADGGAAFARG